MTESDDLIYEFGSVYDVTRPGQGEYVRGIWVPALTKKAEKFNVLAVVQPLTGKDILLLPEGQRITQAFKVYTSFAMQTVNSEKTKKADTISINDEEFEIHSVEPWGWHLAHFKCVAVRFEAK